MLMSIVLGAYFAFYATLCQAFLLHDLFFFIFFHHYLNSQWFLTWLKYDKSVTMLDNNCKFFIFICILCYELVYLMKHWCDLVC